MTCVECRDLMLEVARKRAAPFVERRVLTHAADCGECRERLAQERAVTTALDLVARQVGAAGASADVESRLLAAFASQAGTGSGATSFSPGVGSRWLPIAAALALAAGAAAWWGIRPERVAPPTPLVARVARVAPVASPVAAPSAPAAGANEPAPRDTRVGARKARPARRVAQAAAPAPRIEAVGFMPIPSAAGLPAFESGEIVRMGIPVTALPNYGVDIPAGGQASVEADLLIGQDGQARAIRLVTVAADGARPRQ